jgi:hypothetical protein
MECEYAHKCNALLRMCLFYTTPQNGQSTHNTDAIQAFAHNYDSELFYSCAFSWKRFDEEELKNVETYMDGRDFYWIEAEAQEWVREEELNAKLLNKYNYAPIKHASNKLTRIFISDINNIKNHDFAMSNKIKRACSKEELELWWQILGSSFALSQSQLVGLKKYINKLSLNNKNYNFWIAYYNNKALSICMTIVCDFEIYESIYDKEMTMHFFASAGEKSLEQDLIQAIIAHARGNNIRALWFLSSSQAINYFEEKDISNWSNDLIFYKKKIAEPKKEITKMLDTPGNGKKTCILF